MEFIGYILRLCVVMLFSVFGTNIALSVPVATSDISYFQTETAHFVQAADVGFAARAPPMAGANVEVIGGDVIVVTKEQVLNSYETAKAEVIYNKQDLPRIYHDIEVAQATFDRLKDPVAKTKLEKVILGLALTAELIASLCGEKDKE